MRHRLLGRSGLRVSELCLGTLTFGETKAWGASAEEAASILGAFADAGGTFIDCAPNYADGAAEEIVGRFASGIRDDFVIATKYTAAARTHPLAGGNSRRSLVQSVEGSLRRLQTDRIDLMWLHYWDGTTPLDEILRALDDLVSAGKILYIGLSDTPAWLVSRAATLAELRGWSRVAAIQAEYNVAARGAERELLPMAEALELAVVCWGALAAGALAGGPSPRRRDPASLPAALAASAQSIRSLAEQHDVAPAALALAWLAHRPGAAVIPLVGARTADQMRELTNAFSAVISSEALESADRVAPPDLGFPHDLIASPYLRKLALGDPAGLEAPRRSRA